MVKLTDPCEDCECRNTTKCEFNWSNCRLINYNVRDVKEEQK